MNGNLRKETFRDQRERGAFRREDVILFEIDNITSIHIIIAGYGNVIKAVVKKQ